MISSDARKSPRQRKLLSGTIQFNNRQSVFDCVVKNLSDGGAKLNIESIVGVPRAFALYIPNLDETYRCEVAWNTMNELGVQFRASRPRQGAPHLQLVQ